MPHRLNSLNQPIGFSVENWRPPPAPPRSEMTGRLCRLEPLDPQIHAEPLFEALSGNGEEQNWTYLAYGPFGDLASFRDWMSATCLGADPQFFAIRRLCDGKPLGVCSYLRITPASGSIEVGHLNFAPALQRTPAATEAMYLMMSRAFELGYRRYEWKCDALNAPSRSAAERLGFSYEGLFRQATVYKQRNRDTAWYSIIDVEWPRLRNALEAWLSPENFDEHQRQKLRLSQLTRPLAKVPR